MTLSPKDNPKQLYPEDLLSDVDAQWRVAHVKSRREKALAHYLAKENIGYYLPMFQKKQANNRRQRFSLVPVFPGYLFFRANESQRYRAVCSNHIARIIDVYDIRQFLDELSQIRQTLSAGVPVYPYDFLNEGQQVRVKSGPLKDLEGIVVRKTNACRLVLSVTSIMQSVAVEIDADQVEPIR